MEYILIGIYILLILYHLIKDINGERRWITVYITFIFLFYLCSHCNYLEIYDLSNYRAQYVFYNPMWDKSFPLYYLFLSLMRLGQIMRMSFVDWWWLTLAGAFLLILSAIKIHQFNPHHFLVFFMMYYLINFYTGLKFFYGFSIYLIATGFLLKGGKKNKVIYILLTGIAGGMHVMYYAYILFAFINTEYLIVGENYKCDSGFRIRKHKVIAIIIGSSLVLSLILRVSGTANQFLGNIFSFVESDTVYSYLSFSTKGGFYIPVILQLLSLHLSYVIKMQSKGSDIFKQRYADVLYYYNLMQVIFYPLFMIAVTFTRLITSASLVTIAAGGYSPFEFRQKKRIRIIGASMLITMAFLFRQLVTGHLWESAIVPLFHL